MFVCISFSLYILVLLRLSSHPPGAVGRWAALRAGRAREPLTYQSGEGGGGLVEVLRVWLGGVEKELTVPGASTCMYTFMQ